MTKPSSTVISGLITYTATGPGSGTAAFKVSLGLFPFLADHRLQDMVILPGSFLVDLAVRVHRECLHEEAGVIRHIEFLHPVLLSDGDFELGAAIGPMSDGAIEYTFYDTKVPAGETPAAPPCAKLVIPRNSASGPGTAVEFGVEDFQRRADALLDKGEFYRRLRANGNQYGPQFQSLSRVWRAGDALLGRLELPPNAGNAFRHQLHTILIDGAAHSLASFFLELGQTFVLQAVGNLEIIDPDLPSTAWVRARLRPAEGAEVDRRVGDLEVFDDNGALYVRLQEARFAHLEWSGAAEHATISKTNLVVSANFTADPIEEVLQFWGEELDFPLQVRFAPYNQVFQELLDPDRQLHRNHDGYNVLLLNLADWATPAAAGDWKLDANRAATLFGDLPRHLLPNGIEIVHLNRHETEYVYKEIFEDQCYLRHGIHLPKDAVVIDIGANIGLFSLFVRSQSPRATVLAYEPSPAAYQALKANCEAYGPLLKACHAGVSDHRGTAVLTFYEKSSVFSTFHADEEEDRQAIRAVVANMVRGELGSRAEVSAQDLDDLMKDRLNRQTFDCPLVSVSDIFQDHHLPRVDLLKIDAEKCELEILHGITEELWPLIDQVVIEVHDRTRRALDEVQEILTAHGFDCAVEEEVLLQASGLFNVYATRPKVPGAGAAALDSAAGPPTGIRSTVDQFVHALDAFSRNARAPTILCVCPPSRRVSPGGTENQEPAAVEADLLQRVAAFPRLHVVGSEQILRRYPAPEYYDPNTDALGHIPYTPEGFAAIGTTVIRTIVGLRRAPYKVIVLDCDHTLWRGACGEDGPLGVTVTPAHRTLQEFMVRQAAAGMLLCLCSKNSEADVWAVFDRNPQMVLKRDHLAGWRINWTAKSRNLRALAAELGLGIDSVIFVDDNPVECAEARAGCPDALTVELPDDSRRWPEFLEHFWAWDHPRVTAEDHTRTQKVRENVERERYRGQVATLKDFIAGLQLQVVISEAAPDEIGRVSQLTYRTNQFNFTTIRRSETEILKYLEEPANRCLVVKVRDRFGDYGLVGLLLYQIQSDAFAVDTLLLSCRVLGRGVEHQILADLGRRAAAGGVSWVDLRFRRSEKNQPAWDFIGSVGADFMRREDDGARFRIPADRVASLRYEPTQPAVYPQPISGEPAGRPEPALRPEAFDDLPGLARKFTSIANNLTDGPRISATMEARRLRAGGFDETAPAAALSPTLEGKLLGIWRTTTGNPRLGVADNFFDAGGTSLKAVRTVAAIRRELQLNVSIVTLFECPTVRSLADKLTSRRASDSAVRDAMERGARRKLSFRRGT